MDSDPGPGQAPPSAVPAVLEQAFERGSLYALRAAVGAHATQAGFPRERVYEIVTAAHELATNAVRHGGGHGRLRLWADGRALHCQVRDDGPAELDANPPDPAAWQREFAHGLWIIDRVADQLTLDRDSPGTTVTASFIINSPS